MADNQLTVKFTWYQKDPLLCKQRTLALHGGTEKGNVFGMAITRLQWDRQLSEKYHWVRGSGVYSFCSFRVRPWRS